MNRSTFKNAHGLTESGFDDTQDVAVLFRAYTMIFLITLIYSKKDSKCRRPNYQKFSKTLTELRQDNSRSENWIYVRASVLLFITIDWVKAWCRNVWGTKYDYNDKPNP